MILILGAGLAGISCSFHLKHNCLVVERNSYSGGHVYSHQENGFVWDEGPHVSFTKSQYVKNLLELSVEGDFLEYPVTPTNYFKGHWIDHPAQSNLHAVPEPIKSKCLSDFLETRQLDSNFLPRNYDEWIKLAFGNEFSQQFVKRYTKKYWTLNPDELSTDWVGERVFFPDVETVKKGFESPLEKSTHYITTVRYPKKGGYYSYTKLLRKGMNVVFNKTVNKICLNSKTVFFSDGTSEKYSKLINTLPLPEFVKFLEISPEIKEAANDLVCSELLLLNFVVNHPATVKSHWLYVYDDDKYATRINFTELLSPNNGIEGKCGIQVEVYFSKYKPQNETIKIIKNKVAVELIEMGLIKNDNFIEEVNTNYIKYANVIFDHKRQNALTKILDYLSNFGLVREEDDLLPASDWTQNDVLNSKKKLGDIVLAGRFGQWKYYWSDDCILRGKFIAENL